MSKTPGQILFEACREQCLLNDIRGWDTVESEQFYNGSTWKTRSPGLREQEKEAWERAAHQLRLSGF